MGQARCQRANMDFELMAVRIEKIKRVAFAFIDLPQRHLPQKTRRKRFKSIGADVEGEMGVILSWSASIRRRAFEAKPERPRLKVSTAIPARPQRASKKTLIKPECTRQIRHAERDVIDPLQQTGFRRQG